MNYSYNYGRSFVAIMVVIAVSALLLRIAIEQVIRINIIQNESNAQDTLKLISAALENYARDHLGAFPENFHLLIQTNPPYMEKDYIFASPVKGYNYSCSRLEASSYSCTAAPVRCKLSGKNTYTISTAGVLVGEDCSKKE